MKKGKGKGDEARFSITLACANIAWYLKPNVAWQKITISALTVLPNSVLYSVQMDFMSSCDAPLLWMLPSDIATRYSYNVDPNDGSMSYVPPIRHKRHTFLMCQTIHTHCFQLQHATTSTSASKFWPRNCSNGTRTISYPFHSRLHKSLTRYTVIQILQQSIWSSTLVRAETEVSQNMRNSLQLNCYDDWCGLHPNTNIHEWLFQHPSKMEKPSFRKILDKDGSRWSHHTTVQFWIGLEMGVYFYDQQHHFITPSFLAISCSQPCWHLFPLQTWIFDDHTKCKLPYTVYCRISVRVPW